MKRIIILLLLIFISIPLCAYMGDGLGDYKLKRTLDADGHTIMDGVYTGDGSGLFGVGLATSSAVTTDGRAGENLTKGDVVYISGATGTKPQFKKADFDSITNEQIESIGVAAETKNNGQAILIRNLGVLPGIDMSDFSAGDELWLWETGTMTNVQPSSGAVVHIGHALNALGSPNGVLMVHHETPVTGVYGQVGHPVIIRIGDGNVISFRDGQDNEIATMTESSMTFNVPYTVAVSSLLGTNGSISIMSPTTYYGSQWGRGHDSKGWDDISLKSISPDGRDYFDILGKTTFYGSSWWRGHDIKGVDNVEANSFTVANEYTLPTADGNNGEVPTTDGAGALTFTAVSGGNKNDEIRFNAGSFVCPGAGNNASIGLRQKEATFLGAVSTVTIPWSIKLTGAANPCFAEIGKVFPRQWDDGTVTAYINYCTTDVVNDKYVIFRIAQSSAPFVIESYAIQSGSFGVTCNGWDHVLVATITVTTTALGDGKSIKFVVGKDGGAGYDTTDGTDIHIRDHYYAYTKD